MARGLAVAGLLAYDVEAVRAHFPALGRGITFFDGPAGTQTPSECIDAITEYLRESNSNSTHGAPYRGTPAAVRTNEIIAETHAGIADLLGADPAEVVIGPNMTTLSFAMSRRIGTLLHAGDEILLSPLDHDANIAPWLLLAEERDLVIRWLDPELPDCSLDPRRVAAALTPRTRVVSIGLASNAVGTLLPTATVAAIAAHVHRNDALLWVDAVHATPHVPIDVRALGADLLAFSVYKIYGPHLGVLWGRRALLDSLPAQSVRWRASATPTRLETGVGAYELFAGFLGTLRYLDWLGVTCAPKSAAGTRRERLVAALGAIRTHESGLTVRFLEALQLLPGCTIYGIADPARMAERCPTIAFTLRGLPPAEVAAECNRQGLAVWAGDFASFELAKRLGVDATGGVVRVGIAHYTTVAEIETLLGLLGRMSATARP